MTNSPAVDPLRCGATRAHLTAVLALVLAGAWQPPEQLAAEDPSGQGPHRVTVVGAGHDTAGAASEQSIDLNPIERIGFGHGAPRFLPSSSRLDRGWPALARIGGRLRGRHA
ncbi:hypothetical protein [Accumulibacter sp.]|uniref:hypothetical protein n=1 Tax=Accumulibacter sp. TaxID=2053492 RepID=UPI001AC89FE4|nr:hypothetical protein [Accumulibacter sp.]MBN8455079.1 hypothetical protein [Accumulibacter sp.]